MSGINDGANRALAQWVRKQKAMYELPVLDENGLVTGETYDVRMGHAGQPDPNRFSAHLQYLFMTQGNANLPKGEPVKEFNPIDPYESENTWQAITNTIKKAYTESITGDLESLVGDETPNLFGLIDTQRLEQWQPNLAEQIAGGIGSFFMPADLAILAAGGAVGGAASKAGKLGALASRVLTSGSQLGTYEGVRGFFEGLEDPNKSALEEASMGFGKGAILGGTLGLVGGAIPATVGGSEFLSKVSSGAAEVFTLGTVSPVLEGRAPEVNDFISAAGFIAGIRSIGVVGGMRERSFNRKRLNELERLKQATENGQSFVNAVALEVERAITENNNFDSKWLRKLKHAEEGEYGTLQDFLVGENIRKLYTEDVLKVPVKVQSRPPKGVSEVDQAEVAGWVGFDTDGKYKIFVNPEHPREMGMTVLHEAAHLMRRARGRELGSEKAERTAGEMAKYASKVEPMPEAKPLTEKQKGVLAQRVWTNNLDKSPMVRTASVTGPEAQKTLNKILPKTKTKPQEYIFISEEASRARDNANTLYGKKRKGITIGIYESEGKKVWTAVDVSAPSQAERAELLRKGQAAAKAEGRSLYVSPQISKTKFFKEMQKQGLASEKPVGKYYKVDDVATERDLLPKVRDAIRSDYEKAGDVLNSKVEPLVFELNKAGIETTLSGDLYGENLVYVSVNVPEHILKSAKLPAPWLVVRGDVTGTESVLTGKEAAYSGSRSDFNRIARKGGKVTYEEAKAVASSIKQVMESEDASRIPEVKAPVEEIKSELVRGKGRESGGKDMEQSPQGRGDSRQRKKIIRGAVRDIIEKDGIDELKSIRKSRDAALRDEMLKLTRRDPAEIAKMSRSEMEYVLSGGRTKPEAYRMVKRKAISEGEKISKETGEKLREVAGRLIPESLKQFRNRMTAPISKEFAGEIDNVLVATHRRTGEVLESMRKGGLVVRGKIEQFLTGKSTLTEADGRAISKVLDPKIEADIQVTPEQRAIAEKISAVLKDFHRKNMKIWEAAGEKLGTVADYFPRILKREIKEAMYNDISAIEGELAKGKTTSDQALKKVIESRGDWFKNGVEYIMKSGQAKSLKDAVRLLTSQVEHDMFASVRFEKPRKLKLPSSFYETDARVVLPEYVMAMSKRAAELEQWGKKGERAFKKLEEIKADDYQQFLVGTEALKILTGEKRRAEGFKGKGREFFDAVSAFEFATKIGLGRGALLNLTQPIISFGQEMGIWNAIKGAIDLFNPATRSFLRESGAVDKYLLEAFLGYRPGGKWGILADKIGIASGFVGVNKMLQYWSASTFVKAAEGWHAAASKPGIKMEWARKRLADFGIDPNKPIEAQRDKLLDGAYRYATDSQLQGNLLKEPLFLNEPKMQPLLLFKRFGIKQMLYLKDTMTRELQRGNIMPLLRLGVAGFLGGEATIWAMNKIKSMLSGEPAYRKDDSLSERFIENLSFIGSLGMMSDIMNITQVTKIPGAVKFTLTPVMFKDTYDLLDTVTKFLQDWDQYGDAWLATERNAHGLFGVLGSYPRYGAERLRTSGQKTNEIRYRKGVERREIFQLLLDGNWEAASRRVRDWNSNYKGSELTMKDVGPKAMLDWAEQRAKSYAEQQTGDKKQAKTIAREKLSELRERIKQSDLPSYMESLR